MNRILGAALGALLVSCAGGGGNDGGDGPPIGDVSAVASIELGPPISIIKVGKSTRLRLLALDAEGKIIGNVPFTFTVNDPSVASVDHGTVTGIKEGGAIVSASANGVTSEYAVVSVVDELPFEDTSDTLIAAAVSGGQLDDETALLYRVFAAFNDPRLPIEYRGNDEAVFESSALDDASDRWESLSEETRSTLEPFYAPPAYVGSWASVGKTQVRSTLGICQRHVLDPNWASIPAVATNARVRVWYEVTVPNGRAQAQRVLDAFEKDIWDKVTAGMGMKAPLSDADEGGCNGGDALLDVYLGDMAVMGQKATNLGETNAVVAPARKHAPVSILLKRSLPDDQLIGSATHEFMHACQWAYDVKAFSNNLYTFLKDATAQEAIDFVYPANNTERNAGQIVAYTDDPDLEINRTNIKDRQYGSYLFFQYLVRTGSPTVIGDIWSATEAESDELKALDRGIRGGLKSVWPGFALTLWNDKPISDQAASFEKWDGMVEKPSSTSDDGDLRGSAEKSLELPTETNNAAIRFHAFDFTDLNSRSVMFHNTYFSKHRSDLPISVQAMWQTEDGLWAQEDWSDLEWVGFCRDQKDQRLKKLVLVVASAQVSGSPITAGESPSLAINTMPCWGVEGTASRVTRQSGWSSGSSQYSMTGRWGFKPATQYFDAALGMLRVQIAYPTFADGQSTFDENYTAGACTHRASGSWAGTSITSGGDIASSFVMNIFVDALPPDVKTSQAELIGSSPRAYVGTGENSKIVTGSVTGMNCSSTYTTSPGLFLLTDDTNPRFAAQNGNMSGTFVSGDDTLTWSFTPLREP